MNITGDGNPKLIGFSSNKEVTASLSSAIFDNRAMALLTGNDIALGGHDVYQREVLIVASSKVAVKGTPKDEKLIALYVLGADGVEAEELTLTASTVATGEYKVTGKDVTVHTDIDAGTTLVAYYMVDAGSTSQTITVSSDRFPSAFKLVMEVLVTDFHTQMLYPAQIIIPSARMEDSWALSFEAEGDPQALDLPIEVLKPANSNDMFTLTIYEDVK